MVPIKKHQQCTGGGGHHQKSAICEGVIIKLSKTVFPPDGVLLLLIASVQDTKIQITAVVVPSPVIAISIEDAVDDQVRKRKEQRRYPGRMFLEFVSLEKSIKHKARIGEGRLGRKVGGWHRTRIRRTRLTQGGDQGIVKGSIGGSISISDLTLRRYGVVGNLQWIRC
jgi:hypothetical protein